MRTDGVRFRESVGTGPVVPKVVPVITGAVFSGITMDQLSCASLSPDSRRPSIILCWYNIILGLVYFQNTQHTFICPSD